MLLASALASHPATELDVAQDGGAGGPRVDSENAVIALARRGVRSSVIRLAPTVHSSLDRQGFVPILIAMARKNGVAGYVGDGSNRWPAVHTLDAARLYRLALEAAPGGSRLHGTADEGVPFRDIAEAIARGTGLRAASVTAEEAGTYFGFLAAFVQRDNPASSAQTQQLVRWKPTHAGLLADLADHHYFENGSRA